MRIFAACVAVGFVGTFGGAHLIAELLAPAPREAFDLTLVVLGLLGAPAR